MPDAVPGALAYRACESQWQYAPSGMPTGLRYADCLALLQLRASAWQWGAEALAEAVADMQVIEAATTAAVLEIRERERADRGSQ